MMLGEGKGAILKGILEVQNVLPFTSRRTLSAAFEANNYGYVIYTKSTLRICDILQLHR